MFGQVQTRSIPEEETVTELDERPKLDEDEQDMHEEIVETPAKPMPVAEFEGSFITEMEAILPRLVIEMPEGYSRDTHLRLALEVRIKSVRLEENRAGELVRQHVLAIEDVQLVSA